MILLTIFAAASLTNVFPQIDAKHVDSGGTHSDPSNMLWLDGKASNPGGVGG